MAFYIYIHGLNSGRQSRSGAALEKVIGAPVFRAVNDYSKPYGECLADLVRQIRQNAPAGESLRVMGTSLGGFYALQLRLPEIERVMAWNPVVFPALQLARFVGKNTRFTDNADWFFPQSSLLSYAAAPDPRQWDNFYQARQAKADKRGTVGQPPLRFVTIGKRDDLLDPELCAIYWRGHASLMEIDSGHSVENFEHVLGFLN